MGSQRELFGEAEPTVYGTEPKLLVRTDAVDTSVAAAQSVNSTHLEAMVHRAIAKFGESGCISEQIVSKFSGYPYSSITARYRALLDKGLIVDTGERRKCASGRQQRVMKSVVKPVVEKAS